jgi:hypothetical protein
MTATQTPQFTRPPGLPPDKEAVLDFWRNVVIFLADALAQAQALVDAQPTGPLYAGAPAYLDDRWEDVCKDCRTLVGVGDILLASLECAMPPWLAEEARDMRAPEDEPDDDQDEDGQPVLPEVSVIADDGLPRMAGQPYWQQ